MNISDRLLYLINNRYGENKSAFAKEIGITPTTLSNYINRENKSKPSRPSSEVLESILNSVKGLNAKWLLTGIGNPFEDEKKENSDRIIDTEEDYKEAIEQGLKLLPEVNFKFSAGQVSLLSGTEDITRYWYLPDCKDCEGVAQVVGSSMTPALPAGCWVALKKYTLPNGNPNTIPFGNIFGVVLEDKATGEYHGHIKVLRRYKEQELSRKYWIAHSINKDEFDDFDIEIAQVKSLWIVKQHIVSDILL